MISVRTSFVGIVSFVKLPEIIGWKLICQINIQVRNLMKIVFNAFNSVDVRTYIQDIKIEVFLCNLNTSTHGCDGDFPVPFDHLLLRRSYSV